MGTQNSWNNQIAAANSAITLNSGTNAVNISTDASATTVSIATGGAVKTVQLGTTNTTSATVIKSGSGNIALNSGLTVDSTGRNTNTVQPAFSVVQTASVINVSGDGSNYTLGTAALTKIFDQGTNITTAGVFTAPITGKYQFDFTMLLQNCVAVNYGGLVIATTLANYAFSNDSGMFVGSNSKGGSILANMTAGDTAYLVVSVAGGTKTVEIYGTTADPRTIFTGYLVC